MDRWLLGCPMLRLRWGTQFVAGCEWVKQSLGVGAGRAQWQGVELAMGMIR
jgi:hypothetical protein